MLVVLSVGNTVLEHVVEAPSQRQTVAHLARHTVLLAHAVDQLLSGQSHLHDLVVLLQVQLLDGVLDGGRDGEGPGHRAVLGLADGRAERVLSQTAVLEDVVARVQRRHQVTQVGVVVHRDHIQSENSRLPQRRSD